MCEPCRQLLTGTSTFHLAPCSALSAPQPEGLAKAASADLSLTQNLPVASYCHEEKIAVCVHAFLPLHLPLSCPEPSPNPAPPPLSSPGQALLQFPAHACTTAMLLSPGLSLDKLPSSLSLGLWLPLCVCVWGWELVVPQEGRNMESIP